MATYYLNPNLIASKLSDSSFAIYAPPEPTPYRLSSQLWLTLQASANDFKSEDEWAQYLSGQRLSHDEETNLNDLLDKNIILQVHVADEQPTTTTQSPQNKDSVDSLENIDEIEPISTNDDVSESASIKLLKINPAWPYSLQQFLLGVLRLQITLLIPMALIIISYLMFAILNPGLGGSILFANISELDNGFDAVIGVLVGLLSVNLFSTLTTWLAQSLTQVGDGWIILRFLFGFIPRFGVHPYSGTAFKASHWNSESNRALLCIAQPLLARLSLASVLILLLASGRLQAGLAGSHLYLLANLVLQICLISFVILALPFRMSPGYRLMILLTDLPPSTLGRSVAELYLVSILFFRWFKDRDQEIEHQLKELLSSRKTVALILFACIFIALTLTKLALLIILIIPRIASDSPEVFGGASQYIFVVILSLLLFNFLRRSIAPKLSKLRAKATRKATLLASHSDLLPQATSGKFNSASRTGNLNNKIIILLIFGAISIIPIDRTVTGSVVVSSERDLTVRAPDDVKLLSVLKSGPSSQIVAKGTPLAELQSMQLESELFQINTDLAEDQKILDTLREDRKSSQLLLLEVDSSLGSYKAASELLESQLIEMQQLYRSGAVSGQAIQDLLLQSFELQENQRLKFQQKIELQADLKEIDIKIHAAQKSIAKSLEWQRSLLNKKENLTIVMPFNGLITSTTSALLNSFFAKGETILELREGSLQIVNVLVPDHDRALVKLNQPATVRLYANPNQSLPAYVHSIQPSSELIDQKVYFQVTLRLEKPLSPNLLQSSGAARIKCGDSNLFLLLLSSIGRFISVDVWSWTP